MRLWVALLLVLFLLPAVHAQSAIENPYVSTPTTMYVHFEGRQDFPINTQAPVEGYQATTPTNILGHSASCLPEGPPLVNDDKHTWYGYSSPGYVEYEYLDDDGYPRIHTERGISYDVELDAAVEPEFTWFLETRWAPFAPGVDPDTVPIALPQVVMQATLRHGDAISPAHEAMNEGAIIAQGRSDPAIMAPAAIDHPHVAYMGTTDDGHHLYRFQFPLAYDTAYIPKDEAFNLRLDLWMDMPLCDGPGHPEGHVIMLDMVRHATGPGARPSFTWNVMNPITIEWIHPQFVGDDLVIHTGMNSPWGNYDVDEDNIQLAIEGPSIPLNVERRLLQLDHIHDHHTEAVLATYIWPYQTEMARDGLYHVTLTISNDQENAVAVGTASFQLGDGSQACGINMGEDEAACTSPRSTSMANNTTPAPAVGLLLAALGAVAARRR